MTTATASLFGKTRAQGDFVRLNASEPAALQLQRWLEDANEGLHRAGARLAGTLGFVYRDGERALVGALAPGEDKVGRAFPLAVFTSLGAREVASDFAQVPALYRAFVAALEAALPELLALPAAQLGARVAQLPLPGTAEREAASAVVREAGAERSAALLLRLFGDEARGQRFYGLRTFLTAMRGQGGVALDCPCTRDADACAWLELARRTLANAPPSFFWREQKLLLAPGAPPPAVLLAFAAPPRPNAKLWPLTTQVEPAIAQARKALAPAQVAAIDSPDRSVDDLWTQLSH